MKKRIILFALSVVLIVGMLSAGNAYAWFSSLTGGSTVANTITAGTITYTLGDNAFVVAGGTVYPEQNLLTGTVNLSNASDITTAVRVKVTYTYGGQTFVWDPSSSTCKLDVTFANGWTYNSDYLYYSGEVAANSGTIPLFTKICYSGEKTDSSLASQQVTVTVIYEARQSQYLSSWSYA